MMCHQMLQRRLLYSTNIW